jgi:uncharacterized membrane protein YidH (DUF202 family)
MKIAEEKPSAGGGFPPCDPRTYMSAERTFLAWIRTGIALMGFGFVIARFGGCPAPTGVALIAIGILVTVVAAIAEINRAGGDHLSSDRRATMADVLGFVEVLGHVLGVVGDAFEAFGNDHQVQAAADGVGVGHHVLASAGGFPC